MKKNYFILFYSLLLQGISIFIFSKAYELLCVPDPSADIAFGIYVVGGIGGIILGYRYLNMFGKDSSDKQ